MFIYVKFKVEIYNNSSSVKYVSLYVSMVINLLTLSFFKSFKKLLSFFFNILLNPANSVWSLPKLLPFSTLRVKLLS